MTVEVIDIKIREDGSRVVRRNIEQIGGSAEKTSSAVQGLKNVLATLGGALAAREVLALADQYTTLLNRLRVTGAEGANLLAVYRALKDVSNETRSSLTGSVELYSRLAVSSKELGVSQSQLIGFTKSLNQAIILSGATAQEAENAIVQLSQGMASGALRGDELRSVMEQLPAVADIIAKGLGVTRGQLRKLGEDGKITAQSILESFQKARGELDEKFAKTVPTVAQSFQVLKNNVIDFVGRVDASLGVTQAVSKAMIWLANNIDTVSAVLASLVAGLVLIGGGAAAVNLLTTAFRALTVAIAANPLGALLVLFTSVITAVTLFRDKVLLGTDSVTTLGDYFRAFGEIIGRVFSQIVTWAEATFGPLVRWIRAWAEETNVSLIGVLRFVARGVDTFVGAWRGAVQAVTVLFESWRPAIGDIVVSALNYILGKIGNFVNKAGELLSTVTEFAGLGKITSSIDLTLTNENKGAAQRLGAGMADAFMDGFKQSNGALKFIDDLAKRAQEIGAQRRAAEAPAGSVSTVAGKAAPALPDEKALKALEQFKNTLRGLLNQIAPVEGALLEQAKAYGILDEALKRKLITDEQHARYLQLTAQYFRDMIDPLGKVNREMDEQIALLRVSAQERGVEAELQRVTKDLQQQGITLTQTETAALRDKLVAMRDLNLLVQEQDTLIQNSVAARQQFSTQLQAIQNLLATPGSGFTQGDAAQAGAGMLSALGLDLAATQIGADAQLAVFQNMYDRIKEMRMANLISEQDAQMLLGQVAAKQSEQRLAGARDLFGQMATLQNSGNKKLAAIGKAAAVTQATIDGVLAVQKALASYPPPMNYAMAAAVGVTAAANVAQIMSSGYERGGYTGNAGTKQVAGVVHGQEFVVNAEATRRNRMLLEAMNNGQGLAGYMGAAQGYEQGGYVGASGANYAVPGPMPTPVAPAAVAPATAASSPAVQANTRIINVLDPGVLEDYLTSSEGEQVFINMIRRNTDAVRTVMSEG